MSTGFRPAARTSTTSCPSPGRGSSNSPISGGCPNSLRIAARIRGTLDRSHHGRRIALHARRQRRIPLAHDARVAEGRARELHRVRVRVGGRAHVLLVEDELAQLAVPVRGRRRQGGGLEGLARGGGGGGGGAAVSKPSRAGCA